VAAEVVQFHHSPPFIKETTIEPLTLVKQKYDTIVEDKRFVFLGEIRKMREHGVFVGTTTGRVYTGYHIFDFIELTEDEI
jgi:hypothetical protein